MDRGVHIQRNTEFYCFVVMTMIHKLKTIQFFFQGIAAFDEQYLCTRNMSQKIMPKPVFPRIQFQLL